MLTGCTNGLAAPLFSVRIDQSSARRQSEGLVWAIEGAHPFQESILIALLINDLQRAGSILMLGMGSRFDAQGWVYSVVASGTKCFRTLFLSRPIKSNIHNAGGMCVNPGGIAGKSGKELIAVRIFCGYSLESCTAVLIH